MKKFSRHKTLAEIKAQCEAQGVSFSSHMYDMHGWDTVYIGRQTAGYAYAIYNTFNGEFFGRTPSGVAFSSDSTRHEDRRWFQQLLNFFYE